MTSNLFCSIDRVNLDQGFRFGEEDVHETMYDAPGNLYRACVREYGRCISRMYIDTKDGRTKSIGWVFLKIDYYEDTGEPFRCETWVTLHDAMPTRTVQHHYHELG